MHRPPKFPFFRSSTRKFITRSILIGASALIAFSYAQAQDEYQIDVPEGLPPVPVPDDNPMTAEKVELGKLLYFDTRLSEDKTVSCASCHMPDYAYAEPLKTSEGIGGAVGERNANTVINTAYATSMFWDGREPDLEHQAAGPVENPIEMGHDMAVVAEQLNEIEGYQERFQAVFGEPASRETITKAIAAFERTILSGNSPYDRGEMSEEAQAGMQLFNGKFMCATCHTPPLFSNWTFANAGVGIEAEEPDVGRMGVTGEASDKGAFRVPHLREIEHTAPYMHDGSIETLEEAVRFMAEGGQDNPNLHPLFRAIKQMNATDEEVAQLTAFMKALSGEYPIVEEPELPQ